MHHGTLLTSLLGTQGNNPVAKPAPQKPAAEAAARFQEAMDQARPQVAVREAAARKPAARAEPARNDEPQRKTEPSRKADHSRPEPATARAKESARHDPAKTDTCIEATSNAANVAVPATTANPTVATTIDDEEIATVTTVEEVDVEPTAGGVENLLAMTAQPMVSEQATVFDPLALSDAIAPLPAIETNAVEPSLGDASLLQTAPLIPLAGSEVADTPDVIAASALLAVATPINTPSSTNTLSSGTAIAPDSGNIDLPFNLNVLSAATTATEDQVDNALLTTSDTLDPIDNPDLALLNGKASFGKLLEAQLGTGERAAVIPDVAKPAITTGAAAVESLTRFAEAQSPAARSFVVQTGVPIPVGQPQWSQAVGDKVLWLAAQNVSAAEIRLDPPDLGPMHVKVTVNQDQANISFSSPHAVVRDALDQQLNRLRDMFAEQGLNLVNVDVSDRSFAQQERDGQSTAKGQAGTEEDEELQPVALSQVISTRLVDHYA